MPANLMPIGRFSTATRLSVRMLRHYDETGLLRPAWVDPSSGYRYYSHEQARTAEIIRLLRQLGMPLEQIREILEARDPELVRTQLAAHRLRVEEQLAVTRRTLTYLERLIEQVNADGDIVMYDVTVKDVAAQTVLTRRGHTPMEDLGRWIGQSLGLLGTHLGEHAGRTVGPPAAIYHSFGVEQDELDVELYLPLAGPVPSAEAMPCYELPGSLVAFTIHPGPYEEVGSAHAALSEWVQRNGHETAGPPREIYLTDPRETPSIADYRTEVIWPIH